MPTDETVVETAPATEAPATDTAATSSEGTATTSETPSYKVKVDGQELDVSLDELLNGYSRQSDYTRKSQALAAERQQMQHLTQLAQALDTNPQATLQALAEAYGIGQPDETDLDPEERRWKEVEQFMAQQQEQQRQAAIDREIAGLKSKYGNVDEYELIQHATTQRIPNLEAAFAHLQFTRKQEADREAATRKAEEERRVDAKKAAGVVEGGSNTQAGFIDSGKREKGVRAAFLAAKKELGME